MAVLLVEPLSMSVIRWALVLYDTKIAPSSHDKEQQDKNGLNERFVARDLESREMN
jgi:hypothetical protein